jgi:hypothetical protein
VVLEVDIGDTEAMFERAKRSFCPRETSLLFRFLFLVGLVSACIPKSIPTPQVLTIEEVAVLPTPLDPAATLLPAAIPHCEDAFSSQVRPGSPGAPLLVLEIDPFFEWLRTGLGKLFALYGVRSVAFSPDGKRLASISVDDERQWMILWDLSTVR